MEELFEKIAEMQEAMDLLKEEVEKLTRFRDSLDEKESKKHRAIEKRLHPFDLDKSATAEMYQSEYAQAAAEYDRNQLMKILNYEKPKRKLPLCAPSIREHSSTLLMVSLLKAMVKGTWLSQKQQRVISTAFDQCY
jgi:hypothetical protein